MGLIHEKNQRPKFSCYCTFKGTDTDGIMANMASNSPCFLFAGNFFLQFFFLKGRLTRLIVPENYINWLGLLRLYYTEPLQVFQRLSLNFQVACTIAHQSVIYSNSCWCDSPFSKARESIPLSSHIHRPSSIDYLTAFCLEGQSGENQEGLSANHNL